MIDISNLSNTEIYTLIQQCKTELAHRDYHENLAKRAAKRDEELRVLPKTTGKGLKSPKMTQIQKVEAEIRRLTALLHRNN